MLKQTKSKQQGFSHLLGIVLIVVLVAIGSIGFFVYKKHQGKTAAHASSLNYKYGVTLRNDAYATILACRRYDASKHSFNAISVLVIRNTTNPKSRYYVPWVYVELNTGSGTGPNDVGYAGDITGYDSNSINYDYSMSAKGKWYYNMWHFQISTVKNGHNYIGYASAFLHVNTDNKSNPSNYLLNLVHANAPGNQFRGRYRYIATKGTVDGPGYAAYPNLRDLPACHY